MHSPPGTPSPALLLPTKLFVPQAGEETVARPRLRQLLSDGAGTRLVLVSAPAGSGKTTLVADWLREWGGPSGWVSLDPIDDDPLTFLRYLTEALEGMAKGGGERTRILLGLTPPPPAELLVGTLLAELTESGAQGVLVLDDYHVLSSPLVHELMTLLVERAPPGVTFLVISRNDPPLPLARLRARGHLREVREADLRFRPQEAASLLSRFSRVRLTEETVGNLVDRTEGWAVGLQLAALALRGAGDPSAFVSGFRGTHAYVADYLTDEVLAGIPGEIQRFLVETSVLKRMTGPLCDAALQRTGSQDVLESLARANLFLVPLDGERRWFRYHHLFADLLRRRLPGAPEGVAPNGEGPAAEILRRAASWCEEHGQVDDAVEYSVRAGAVERAAELVARHGVDALSRGEVTGVLGWLRLLPQALVRSSPDHCILGAWAHSLLEDPETMGVYATTAAEAWRAGSRPFPYVDHVEIHARITGAEARAVLAGNPASAIPEVEGLRPDIPEGSGALRTAGGIVLGELLALTGRHREALVAHGEASDLAGEMAFGLLQVTSATGRAENLLAMGRVREALALVEPFLEARPGEGGVLGTRLGNLAALRALAALEVDDLPSVDSWVSRAWGGLGGNPDLEEGWRSAGRLGRASYPGMHSTGRGVLHAHLAQFGAWIRSGEVDRSLDRLARMGEAAPEPAPVVHALKDWIEVLCWERREETQRLARWAPTDPSSTESAFWNDLRRLTRARAALAIRDGGSAEEFLLPLEEELREREAHLLLVPALLLRAEALADRHRRVEAQALLREALGLTAREERMGPWLDARSAVVPLLEEAVGRGEASAEALDHATQILFRRRASGPSQGDPGGETGAVPLSDRELAVLRLVAAGRTNEEIARALFLAVGTVKKHTHNIYGKLGVRNRTGAVDRARQMGLLEG